MNFAATEAEDFDVVIVLDVEANGIEIGQGLTFLIFFPVIRIAAEKDIGAGAVIGDIEGAEDGHFFFGRVGGENGARAKRASEPATGAGKVTVIVSAVGVWTLTWPSLERKESPVG